MNSAASSIWDSIVLLAQVIFAQLMLLDGYALVLACLTPFLLIYARQEILIKRLRTILDFMQSFKLYGNGSGGHNPSFEFVKSKYVSDIKIGKKDQADLDTLDRDSKGTEEAKLKFYINLAARSGSRSSRQIYMSSLGLAVVCYFGFHGLRDAFTYNFHRISPGSIPAAVSDQMLVIGSLAFAGAFVGAIRMLLRCLAVYDLSSFAMLRHTAEIVFSVILIMLIFRAFPDPLHNVGKLLLPDTTPAQVAQQTTRVPADVSPDQPAPPVVSDADLAKEGIPWLWFALAPVFGLLPASSTRFLLLKMQSLISWIKTTDDRFADVSKVISLDIIDGIDFETRFRLEECGIYDVQNLATYNPVMLHIETPYGIYQAIDWIAQAQLCHIVGQEKFLMFREVNIRTIFDLERAIDSVHSPAAFDNIYASILFAPSDNLKRAAAITQFRFLITDEKNLTRQVSVEEYCAWARQLIQSPLSADSDPEARRKNEETFSAAVEHLMVWISDDLHIRRLRRLWLDISNSLGKQSDNFPDSKRLQARREYLDEVCAVWCEEKRKEKEKTAKDTPFPGGDNGGTVAAPQVPPEGDNLEAHGADGETKEADAEGVQDTPPEVIAEAGVPEAAESAGADKTAVPEDEDGPAAAPLKPGTGKDA